MRAAWCLEPLYWATDSAAVDEDFNGIIFGVHRLGAIKHHHVTTFALHLVDRAKALIIGFQGKPDDPLIGALPAATVATTSGVSSSSNNSGCPVLEILRGSTRWGR